MPLVLDPLGKGPELLLGSLVGAPFNDGGAPDRGAAYILQRQPGGDGAPDAWVEIARLMQLDDDADAEDWFGFDVGITEHAAVVGCPNDDTVDTDAGCAYVFEYDLDGCGCWAFSDRLVGSESTSFDRFGLCVDIDCEAAVVGAPDEGIGIYRSGAGYVFRRVAARQWDETHRVEGMDTVNGDQFGFSCGVGFGSAIFGARLADDAGAGIDAGAAYAINEVDGSCELDELVCTIVETGLEDNGGPKSYARALAFFGPCLLVGDPANDDAGPDAGAVHVFCRDEGGPQAWGFLTTIIPSSVDAGDEFGSSVGSGGGWAIVGAPRKEEIGIVNGLDVELFGAAYIYDADGLVSVLQPDELDDGDRFGASVDIAGNVAVVGAPGDDDKGLNAGALYVYEYAEVGGWGFVDKLTGDDTDGLDRLGESVACTNDVIVGGAPNKALSRGAAYVFTRGNGDAELGSPWEQFAKLQADDRDLNDDFGTSVDVATGGGIGDTHVIVGVPRDDDAGFNAGAAYVFSSDASFTAMTQSEKLFADDATPLARFGESVAIDLGDERLAVVGAPLAVTDEGDESGLLSFGAAYLFEQTTTIAANGGAAGPNAGPGAASAATAGGEWEQIAKLFPIEDEALFESSGDAVALRSSGPNNPQPIVAMSGIRTIFAQSLIVGTAYVFDGAALCEDDGGDQDDASAATAGGPAMDPLAELHVLLADFGRNVAPGRAGDVTGDGRIDLDDLNALLDRLGG